VSGVRSTSRWQRIRAEMIASVLQCPRCGCWLDRTGPRGPATPTVDHIVPLKLGGSAYARDNLRVLCMSCNSTAGGGLRRATPRPGASKHIRRNW
jgi:5-methylcytosine-specific restriction endonuclease McrA